jgi:hypothetical protein
MSEDKGLLPSVEGTQEQKLVTECCDVPILANSRFCQKCGWEARIKSTPSVVAQAEYGVLPSDDEITTIRWGRLRELFDAEAEVMRRASPAVTQAPPCSGCGELMERVSYRCGSCGTFRSADTDAVAQAHQQEKTCPNQTTGISETSSPSERLPNRNAAPLLSRTPEVALKDAATNGAVQSASERGSLRSETERAVAQAPATDLTFKDVRAAVDKAFELAVTDPKYHGKLSRYEVARAVFDAVRSRNEKRHE